ncbi:MAG: SpoVR family protein [Hydrogenophilaceae bacterium]|jgi:spore cortex formation protein SpoVR/YcgB (stage V sporulation)|nr:SpoVR family protein [Hydrogenophilaceae bacterium]
MSALAKDESRLLYTGMDWDFPLIQRIYGALEEIALGEMKLDPMPNQIEVITSEQMLDAYASTGMPLFYNHWSFGKHFARNEAMYRKGFQGLAYEIVINSNPCIVYIMEENTVTMQTLVMAHAGFGHNHFFKHNHVFKLWTDADGILDYLAFAKSYIAQCEERYGQAEVERLLDAAHALQSHGVHRSPRKRAPNLRTEEKRERERREHGEKLFNDLWRTVPGGGRRKGQNRSDEERRRALLGLPEENILYFLEKTAPRLLPWQREVLRIVRNIAQYFYPQRQTQVMNEGCATFTHHRIMTRLHEQGRINDGAYMEFLHSHTNVITQPSFDDPRYNGINPYALGFAMMQDIERITLDPTEEDRFWFPEIAGNRDPYETLKDVWANFRDESFLSQYLSPNIMRRFGLFLVNDDEAEEYMKVSAIHDERGYRNLRRAISRQYDLSRRDPDIHIVDVDLVGERRLELQHRVHDGVQMHEGDLGEVLQRLADLWGYEVLLKVVDAETEDVIDTHEVEPNLPFGVSA